MGDYKADLGNELSQETKREAMSEDEQMEVDRDVDKQQLEAHENNYLYENR